MALRYKPGSCSSGTQNDGQSAKRGAASPRGWTGRKGTLMKSRIPIKPHRIDGRNRSSLKIAQHFVNYLEQAGRPVTWRELAASLDYPADEAALDIVCTHIRHARRELPDGAAIITLPRGQGYELRRLS